MATLTVSDIKRAFLAALPKDGSSMGNIRLRRDLAETLGKEITESLYEQARDELVDEGKAAKGQGRGGSVRRLEAQHGEPLILEAQEIPSSAERPVPTQTMMSLMGKAPGQPTKPKARNAPRDEKVLSYRHDQRRVNNPEVGLVTPDDDADEHETRYAYDPHIDPALQFDSSRARFENLIDDALASGDEAVMRKALAQLKRQAAPYLNWTGNAERTSFEVDTVSLHVHERIDPATILTALKKRPKPGKVGESAPQYQDDWLRAWFDRPLPLREAIEFYKHDRGWSNRLITGDSLLVMNSLLQKESMAGQVQMIYIDPPYGIKYGSNFQPFVNKHVVKDRSDNDLTQEPEMIKAFRDTWELGIHSYLTYLRDRLLLAKELLHESGSVFVQISDENVHLVRNLMDEVMDCSNFIALIPFKKTSALGSAYLDTVNDYLVWYSKSKRTVKYRQLYAPLTDVTKSYTWISDDRGSPRRLTSNEKKLDTVSGSLFRTAGLTSQSGGDSTGYL